MKTYRFEIILGALLVALYRLFSFWHSQGRGEKLTQPEIDHYLQIIEKLPLPEEDIKAICARIRPWAEADDGKPVYMFNLINFFPELRPFPGAPEFSGTPEESNAYYEKKIMWLWLRHAAYPMFKGKPQAKNLIDMQPERSWGEVAIARYPSRRTFLKLLADPAYAPMEPYKFMALEIDLVPAGSKMMIPDLRWVVGGLLTFVFLMTGWLRAVNRTK
jgi:hypothetical protein